MVKRLVNGLKNLVPLPARLAIARFRHRMTVRLNRLARTRTGGSKADLPAASMRRYAAPGRQTFFGYNDKTPFGGNNRLLLATATGLRAASPNGTDLLSVGYFHLDSPDEFHEVGQTTAWCWQQGCMYQWFPPAGQEQVLYNVRGEQGFESVLQDLRTREIVRRHARPIYCLNGSGALGVSVNFHRLHMLRPAYGYPGGGATGPLPETPADDGVWRVDLTSGRCDLLVSLATLAGIEPQPSMRGAVHYINHAMFNPSGTRLVFFHLWVWPIRRYMRMFTCNPDGSDLGLLTNEEHVSHYAWKSDDQLLAYSTHRDSGRHFHLYQDRTGRRAVVAGEALKDDGHPSYSPDGRHILLDSYPDKYGEQHLFLLNADGMKTELGRFYSPAVVSPEFRCDLHPRWDRTGGAVCVDSTCQGDRAMYVIDVTGQVSSPMAAPAQGPARV